MRTIQCLSLIAAVVALHGPASAAEVSPRSLDSRVTSIALFKNGLAFVTREATLPRGESRLRMDGLPVPVHGTFWAWTPGRPDGIRRLVASLEPSASMRPVVSLGDLVLANAGREVEIVLGDGKSVRGRPVAPATPREGDTPDLTRYIPGGREPILLTTTSGTVAIDPASIQRVNVDGAPPRTEIAQRTPKARLDVETAGEGGDKLSCVYLSRGATWAPSYSVDLLGKDRARVTAKAEIVNELEDLDGAEVKLVTGYPNIAYSNVDDPLAMRGDLAAFLAALGGQTAPSGYGGAMRQNIAFDRLEARADESDMSYSTQPPAGARADELFLYPLPRFTLARGQRAYVPLFSVEVAAEHLYELDLDDRVSNDRFDSQSPKPAAPLQIWHRVRLTNSGTVPWTTAPAMAMRAGSIVAQDELPYSAPGGTSTLRITRVGDLHADADETEIERKPRALEIYGRSYDEITVRGVAEITSLRDEDVTMTVTKNLTGEALATTPAGKVDRTTQRLAAVNPASKIRWTLPLKARGTLKVEYRYKVLIQI